MTKRTKEELKELVINYIRKNPISTVAEIESKFKVNIHRLFKGIENAFNEAHIRYPRERRNSISIRNEIIQLIKKDLLITAEEIQKLSKTNPFVYFDSLKNAYELANIKWLNRHEKKRRLRKQKMVIEFIKNNPKSTQWEINRYCKCHVQEMFKDGIREAFKLARIKYPKNRRKIYGSALKEIRKRSTNYEKRISNILKKNGAKLQVRTKTGIADAIININKKTFVVEIKDYQTKPICLTDIEQINRYLKDLNIKYGIIINRKDIKIRNIKKDGSEILIIPESRISGLFNGVIV